MIIIMIIIAIVLHQYTVPLVIIQSQYCHISNYSPTSLHCHISNYSPIGHYCHISNHSLNSHYCNISKYSPTSHHCHWDCSDLWDCSY